MERGRDLIDSMISSLPTIPALLQNIDPPALRKRLSLLQVVIVLLAGGAHALSLAWPFAFGFAPGQPLWGLQLLALTLLVAQLDGCRTWQRAAKLGGWFATAMLCATFWWLFISMHVYGGLAAPLAVLAVVLLAAFLALYYAAACGLFVLLAPAGRAWRAMVFAALWLLAELARVKLFTGFPWGEGGYAHVDGWARPLAAWVGVHGLSLLAAFAAAWLAISLRAFKVRWLSALGIVAVSMAAAWLPFAGLFQAKTDAASSKPMSVTLLQGNIPQNEKFQSGSGVATALRWYGEQLQGANTALVVAPETAIPLLPLQLPEGYWPALQSRFASGQQAALIGLPLGSVEAGYANAVLGLKPGQLEPYRYDKHHLVPFGEFVPAGFRWFIDLMHIPLGDFKRGAVGQPSLAWQGERLAPNICYEDLFGEELGARFVDAAQAPTIFVNLSNIAWFGNTVAIDQHLQISRMRALEFDRPMIRATNTGATVIIDHQGQVTHSLPRHTRGALVGEVQGRASITPYAWWVGRFGLWPLWALGLTVVGLALLFRRRR
ncbi:apolipoprotein N-acyltransferase [Polaromonas sp. OV174]|uniref:apolipoprotein N-acyltransferase n=1 Tax=Polaromonas sp. OV174 TaxID=1855300 RepID=UPI0008EDD546|nr:apolipoprotein N-acyltransferase [Polaromonas sp. OV174]SFB92302.1 apolipoprotein N-acyltransferase [Polaromonas sp. OV174]